MTLAPGPEDRLGFLRDCLVEGDPDQERRVHRGKQRALFLSIVVQILIVVALVLFPLLSRSENIAGRVLLYPTVPYSRGSSHRHDRNTIRPQGNHAPACRFCQPPSIPNQIDMHDRTPLKQSDDEDLPDIPGTPTGTREGGSSGILDLGGRSSTEIEKPSGNVVTPPRIHIGTIQPAMLYHRVEPIYPPLARQLRHEGRVELRAVISTDGSIQSLEVISGDPLLIQFALAAVREWRYHPTILNGQPVEVDTHITVVYTLSH